MNNKKIFIFIIAIVVLLLASLFYFFLVYNPSPSGKNISQKATTTQQKANNNKPSKIPVNQEGEQKEQKQVTHTTSSDVDLDQKKEFTKVDLRHMASSFAERFGSYSNHSNFANIKDLRSFMTGSMKDWAEDFVQKQSKKDSGEYTGVTTKAISTEVANFDKEGGEAKVVVTTRRRESKGSRDNSTTYIQDLTLEFVQQNDSWKVDSASWE